MIMEDVIGFLKGIPPFQFLDEATLRAVARDLSMAYYPKDTVLLTQGGPPSDALRIIKKGGVRVSLRTEDGEEMVVDYRGEGDTFGFLSLVGKERQGTTVVAMDDTICYLLKKETVLKLLESNMQFMEYFLRSHLTKYIHKTYAEMHGRSLLYGSSERLLFTTRIGDIATKKVVSVDEDSSIREAAEIMAKGKISSLVVLDKGLLPAGIVTDRDLREKVVARARDVNEPVKNIMSLPLIRVDARDYCFEAVLKMIKFNIHHLLVIREGQLDGILTNHDLMLLQGTSPLSFVKDIENQHSVEGLVPVATKTGNVIRLLLKEGAKASSITKIITEINDRLVRKILEIAEKKFGLPPLPYCWIAFGSEGRQEQTFRTDQDNAIVYADPPSEGEAAKARSYFLPFTAFVKDSLVQCGFPPCPADYMASNPRWCQPLKTWKRYFSDWISEPTPEAVLRSLIFFDFRPIHGDFGLAGELRAHLTKALSGQNIFLAVIAGAITRNRPPLGFLKTFVVEKSGEHKDELNLKLRGIGPLVDCVRLFSLEKDVTETSTLERLKALEDKHPLVRELGEELEHAFEFITLVRIHHQMEQMEKNLPPDNFINPSRLSGLEKKSLKEAFQLISKVQDFIVEQYRPGMVGA